MTGALEHIADRVSHLVYLDAFVPQSGESLASHVHGEGRAAITLGEPWLIPGITREFDDPAEGEWMTARRVQHPRACFTEAVFLARPLEDYPFTRTYIKATTGAPNETGNAAFWRAAKRAQASKAWKYFEIATNHVLASNKPEETARLLMKAAGAAR